MARGDSLRRQWKLLILLDDRQEGVSVDEIAEHLGCTVRTVLRDRDVLELFVPLDDNSDNRGERGKKFWRLKPQKLTDKLYPLTQAEAISLLLSWQFLLPLAGTHFGDCLETAMEKIRKKLSSELLDHFKELDDSILVKSLAIHDYSRHSDTIRQINKSILGKKCIEIVYNSTNKGRKVTSDFHPYGLMLLHSSLYCIGHLVCSNEIHTLKIARIEKVTQTKENFERPKDFSLADHFQCAFGVFRTGKKLHLQAEFTDWAATNVREMQWHPSQKILSDKSEKVTVSFELGSTVEFKRWILGFGRHARVIQPKDLATEIREEHLAAAGL